jgi:dynein heavy chain
LLQGCIISTTSTERQLYFLKKLLAGERTVPVVFAGPSGTGKTAVLSDWMRQRLPRDRYLAHRITLSAQSAAEQLQDALFDKLERRRKGLLRIGTFPL